ncbi:hypothetical protein M440DRAFT_1134213 [Trichoderma longibrachiatum ATCC 18648]|uniref:Uncharacterized protein n=1 Tax=Trichoderma longibrachiatum ATCC 18648 TaxID=983965 RepID=A0A2T4CGR5_TRILO|nr:hypothetical protein M440DRAFT_1134213 [Trichoderma longibrachiatum ATCC 18648]
MRLNQETAPALCRRHSGGPSSGCLAAPALLLLLSHSLVPSVWSSMYRVPPLSPIVTNSSATKLTIITLPLAPNRASGPQPFASLSVCLALLHRRPSLTGCAPPSKEAVLRRVSILLVGVRVPFVGSISAAVPWLYFLPRATHRIYLYCLPPICLFPLRILCLCSFTSSTPSGSIYPRPLLGPPGLPFCSCPNLRSFLLAASRS